MGCPWSDGNVVMTREVTEILNINDTLRYVLYGVSVTLDIGLRASEIERLFAASASGNSCSQSYEFHCSPCVRVTGRVEEYEPESLWLTVSARNFDQTALKRLVEAAKHASFGQASTREAT